MDHNESLIALQMVDWIDGAIIWLHLQYLESRRNRFIQDVLRERLGSMKVIIVGGLPTFHLKSDKLAVDLLEFALVVIEPSLPGQSRDRILRRI